MSLGLAFDRTTPLGSRRRSLWSAAVGAIQTTNESKTFGGGILHLRMTLLYTGPRRQSPRLVSLVTANATLD